MKRNLVAQFKRFRHEQDGLTSAEYAVILSLLIAVILTVLPSLADHMNNAFAGVQLDPMSKPAGPGSLTGSELVSAHGSVAQ